eukprot:TRINITY_DN16038_c0_g1_i1.p1 TRINITY_DN16038_c0_g1~~TRINITY_DN16038_c0_g1_i1.p1  ORF type:complete len:300 (-),score=10.79 TRINITY_DN16038_c0_g1_i1:46-816(-)
MENTYYFCYVGDSSSINPTQSSDSEIQKRLGQINFILYNYILQIKNFIVEIENGLNNKKLTRSKGKQHHVPIENINPFITKEFVTKHLQALKEIKLEKITFEAHIIEYPDQSEKQFRASNPKLCYINPNKSNKIQNCLYVIYIAGMDNFLFELVDQKNGRNNQPGMQFEQNQCKNGFNNKFYSFRTLSKITFYHYDDTTPPFQVKEDQDAIIKRYGEAYEDPNVQRVIKLMTSMRLSCSDQKELLDKVKAKLDQNN